MTMTYELTHSLDPANIDDALLGERMRTIRDRLLAACDWTQLPDAPVDRDAWATYRQQLRDFPSTWTPASTVTFPTAPNETE